MSELEDTVCVRYAAHVRGWNRTMAFINEVMDPGHWRHCKALSEDRTPIIIKISKGPLKWTSLDILEMLPYVERALGKIDEYTIWHRADGIWLKQWIIETNDVEAATSIMVIGLLYDGSLLVNNGQISIMIHDGNEWRENPFHGCGRRLLELDGE